MLPTSARRRTHQGTTCGRGLRGPAQLTPAQVTGTCRRVERLPDLLDCGVPRGPERGTGLAAGESEQRNGRLEAWHAVPRRHQTGERRQPALEITGFFEATGTDQVVQIDAQVRHDRGQGQDAAGGAHQQAGVEDRRRPRHDREIVGRAVDQRGQEPQLAARLLQADDVRMFGQPRDGVHAQRHAGERRVVVEHHRHGRRVGDRRVVGDERIGGQQRLEVGRGPDQHRVGAQVGRALRRADGRGGRFTSRAGETEPVAGHGIACGRNGRVRLRLVDQRRLAVGAEHHDTADAGRHPALDVRRHRRHVDLPVPEGSGNGREHAIDMHGWCCSRTAGPCQAPAPPRPPSGEDPALSAGYRTGSCT